MTSRCWRKDTSAALVQVGDHENDREIFNTEKALLASVVVRCWLHVLSDGATSVTVALVSSVD